jgi:hypothetical protein
MKLKFPLTVFSVSYKSPPEQKWLKSRSTSPCSGSTPSSAFTPYITAQTFMFILQGNGMIAENKVRAFSGLSPAYGEAEFHKLAAEAEAVLGRDAVLKLFTEAK